jgi:hypothetical protein
MDSSHDEKIEGWFANLKPDEYEVTSPEGFYNCIAWAAGHTDAWWEPAQGSGYYWPQGVPWDDKIETLVAVFVGLGFEICESAAPEAGFEKIAIYGEGGAFLHAARQLDGEKWTSKLGLYKDIAHKTLDGLTGPDPAYGLVVILMRRKIAPPASESTGSPPT